MRAETAWIVGTISVAAIVAVGLATDQLSLSAVVFVTVGLAITAQVATRISTDLDRKWLTTLLPLAFVVKMAGVVARYVMVTVLYESGDSYGYYNRAIELVHEWRQLNIPSGISGGAGTRFTQVVTSLLFLPGIPSFLVGFMLFGTLAFVGVVFFYLAFRPWVRSERALFVYAVLLFFMPSIVFWPSSIGKDAIMVFGLGLAAFGASHLLAAEYVKGAIYMAPGLALATGVRPHLATLMAASVLLALLLARRTEGRSGWLGRLVIASIVVLGLTWVASTAAENLHLDPSTEGLEQFAEGVQSRTTTGGSSVEGNPVRSPFDLPEATLRVLLRPLPHEASNLAMLLSAAETMVLLGIVLWRLPYMWRAVWGIRRAPYVLFSAFYTVGFVVAFSAIFNLGILVRQRVQLWPLLFVVVVGLGWDIAESEVEVELAGTAR